MKFSIFRSAKAQRGEECTYEKFLEITESQSLLKLCNEIAAEADDDKRGELKKQLPVITWQAYFAGRRLAKDAEPSGLFMLDIDHVENPGEMYHKKIANRLNELGIVFVGKTASRKGLRIVARCLPTLHSLAECQRWLASNLKVDYDGVCKDFARCSFVVHSSYTYFMDAAAIWQEEAAEGTKYQTEQPTGAESIHSNTTGATSTSPTSGESVDQREGLFGGQEEYKGIPLKDLALEWLEQTGGLPEKGERNTRLYKLALRMRYVTDFNGATMLKVMPNCGLPESEMREIINSALSRNRAADMPRDFQQVLKNIETRKELGDQIDDDETDDIITDTSELPPMPPVIRQFVEVAPEDFKAAVALCQLPILGALGSKLRAKYLDGKVHSPSFMVSLEAPQASGKSFMSDLVEKELAQMLEHDEAEREKEREYEEKVRELKLLNVKVNKSNKDEILSSRPKTLIRFVPPTMSITKLFMRMRDAKGLHLFAFAPEADTVTKAFKRGFSSFSDLLRLGFENALAGQDYASENSFSGNVRIYYNMLISGTPKAMRRFYPDVEDGLVSRVCFVTLPDQFGKPMPNWQEMKTDQKRIVDIGLVRLNEVTLEGDDVMPDHVMKLGWLNKTMKQWLVQQQQKAVKDNDRTRDIFCRRSAVVGFRAGMLAWFLYGEKNTPTIRRNVMLWSVWVANSMLNQHLLRFQINDTSSNTNKWEDVFSRLGKEFTREDLRRELNAAGHATSERMVLSKWRLSGIIKDVEKDESGKVGRKGAIKFRKI